MGPDFLLVANGGIQDYTDVARVQQATGANAIMSSEGLLETPNLFVKSSYNLTPSVRFQQQVTFAQDYMDLCHIIPPLPGVMGPRGSFNIVKGHLFKFLHRYFWDYPDMRNKLADHNHMYNLDHAQTWLDELQSRYQHLEDDEAWADLTSSNSESSWYRRHWKSKSRVHQRSIVLSKQQLRQRIAKLQEQRLMKG